MMSKIATVGCPKAVLAVILMTSASHAYAGDARSPERFVSITVYGSEACPAAAHAEIVVCGREPESDRYRIPRTLRRARYQLPAQSWASHVHTLDDIARAGRPNGCSVVGPGGQTGCYDHALERWFAERRQ